MRTPILQHPLTVKQHTCAMHKVSSTVGFMLSLMLSGHLHPQLERQRHACISHHSTTRCLKNAMLRTHNRDRQQLHVVDTHLKKTKSVPSLPTRSRRPNDRHPHHEKNVPVGGGSTVSVYKQRPEGTEWEEPDSCGVPSEPTISDIL